MKKLLLPILVMSSSLTFSQTPCSGGNAGGFPCEGYTLQSHIEIVDMGGRGYGSNDPMEAQDSWGWTDPLDGKEYAIVAMNDGTAFVDISNPTSPRFLGRLESHTGTSWWRDVKVYNNYAYVVSDDNGSHGVQIFDLTRLRGLTTSPGSNASMRTFSEDGHYNGISYAHNIIINEDSGFLYILGSNRNSGAPRILDLSNPTNPTVAGNISSSYGYCHDAQVVIYNGPDSAHHGKEILVGSFSTADYIQVLDVTNKSNISQIGIVDYANKRYTHQGWFTEDQKYFIVGDEVDESTYGFNTRTLVFDMTDLDNPVLHHTYYGPTPAIDHNGYVVGNRFYLANYRAGMRVMKIDELYNQTPNMYEVGSFDTHPGSNSAAYHGAWNVYPFFESGNIIVSDLDEGLIIVKDPNYDNQAPNVVCQSPTIYLDHMTGTATIDATDLDNGSTDNFGIVNWTLQGQTTFTCADVGQTFNITITGEDDYGNKDSCVATVTIAAAPTVYLGGGVWSAGAPGVGSNAIISSDYNTTSQPSIDACVCQIDNGATLTIQGGDYLKTEGDITIAGNLIVEHQGSVVQTNPAAAVTKIGGAVINVNVTTPVLNQRDFMIMGSPMTTETRNGVFDSAFLVLNFVPQNFLPHPDVPAGGTNFADDNGDFYSIYNSGPINPGEGYVVRPQSGFGDPAGIPYDFTYTDGTLNNGTITYTNYNNGPTANPDGTPNIVANPYPSPINTDQFLAANPGLNAVYFWEHLTPPGEPLAGSNLRFDMDDISVYNGVMGIPAANDPGNAQGTAPNNVISTSQGFGVRTTGVAGSTGTIQFNNSMRLTSGNTTLRDPLVAPETLLLEVRESTYGYGSFCGIAFHKDGTDGFDEGKDTNRLATIVSLFSQLEGGTEELGIQTLGTFESGTKINVGFSSQIDEEIEYELAINDMEGENLTEATVYLVDHALNSVTILNDNPYTFTSKKVSYPNRFTLLFERNPILGPEENVMEGIVLFPNPTQNNLNLYSPYANLETLEVYDLLGKRLSESIEEDRKGYTLDLSSLGTGVYFVHITTEKGSITKKVIKH